MSILNLIKQLMGYNTSRLIYPVICILLINVCAVVNGKDCGVGQKIRITIDGYRICCNTIVCTKSHAYEYCRFDGGSDICKPCPPGTYTNDPIDTSSLPSYPSDEYQEEIDLCVIKTTCNGADQKLDLLSHDCICNLDKGFYGSDKNNCQLDRQNCKGAGHQLKIDGSCILCPPEQYKPEDGQYRQCRNKTVCKEGEEVISNGSQTHDRTCRIRTTEEQYTTSTPVIETTKAIPGKKDDSSLSAGKIVAIVVSIFICIGLVLCIIYRRRRIIDFVRRRCGRRLYQNDAQNDIPLAPNGPPPSNHGGNDSMEGLISSQPEQTSIPMDGELLNGSIPNHHGHNNSEQMNGHGNLLRNGIHPSQPSGNDKRKVTDGGSERKKTDTKETNDKNKDLKHRNGVKTAGDKNEDDSIKYNDLADSSLFSEDIVPDTMSTAVGDSISTNNQSGNFPNQSLIDSLKTTIPGNTEVALDPQNVGTVSPEGAEKLDNTLLKICSNNVAKTPESAIVSPRKYPNGLQSPRTNKTNNPTSVTDNSISNQNGVTNPTRNLSFSNGVNPAGASSTSSGTRTAVSPIVFPNHCNNADVGEQHSGSNGAKTNVVRVAPNQQQGNGNTVSSKPKPRICAVSPTIREIPVSNQDNSNPHLDFPPSNTTAGGLDVHQASNDEDRKFAPTSAPRNEQEPLVVDLPRKPGASLTQMSPSDNGQGISREGISSNSSSASSVYDTLTSEDVQTAESLGNSAADEGNQLNSGQEFSSNSGQGFNHYQSGSNITSSGNPVRCPDSGGSSQDSSVEQGTRSDDQSNSMNSPGPDELEYQGQNSRNK